MAWKVFFCSAILLLCSWTANAKSIDRDDVSPENYKQRIAGTMDRQILMAFKEFLKKTITYAVESYVEVKPRIPADSIQAKALSEFIKDLESQRREVDKMDEMAPEEMEFTMDSIMSLVGSYLREGQKIDNPYAKKFLDINTKFEVKAKEIYKEMLNKWRTTLTEILGDLRPEDIKKYPQYKEMTDILKREIKTTTNQDDEKKMLLEVMKKMSEFMEVPHTKGILYIVSRSSSGTL